MRTCSSMLGKQATGLLILAGVCLGCHYAASSLNPEPIVFKNVAELKDLALENGLFFHSGSTNGVLYSNFFLADHPIHFDDLEAVSWRSNCGLTSAWRGVLWVNQLNRRYTTFHPGAIAGKWRVWGNVLVAGDESLMDRLEDLYRNR